VVETLLLLLEEFEKNVEKLPDDVKVGLRVDDELLVGRKVVELKFELDKFVELNILGPKVVEKVAELEFKLPELGILDVVS
jgi:hypothetical protein